MMLLVCPTPTAPHLAFPVSRRNSRHVWRLAPPRARAAHAQIHSFPVERTEGRREDKIDGSPDFFAVCEEPVCLVCLALPPSLSLSVLCTRDSSREFRVPRERCQHCKDHKLDWKRAVRRRGGPNYRHEDKSMFLCLFLKKEDGCWWASACMGR